MFDKDFGGLKFVFVSAYLEIQIRVKKVLSSDLQCGKTVENGANVSSLLDVHQMFSESEAHTCVR